MKPYIENLLRGSEEWEAADDETRKAFEKYLDKFFEENEDKMKVPMTFHEWRFQYKLFDVLFNQEGKDA